MPSAQTPGRVLLHIGVHKTGTTAIQAALANSRDVLAEYDVRYPGEHRSQHLIATSAMGRSFGWKDRGASPPDPKLWKNFVAEARNFRGTTVLSSEFFAEAKPDVIESVINDLGVDRVQVVVGVRNLGRLLPSAWQQYLKGGHTFTYEEWLDNIFRKQDPNRNTRIFWRRHQHDDVIRRWSKPVGEENVTVIIIDDHDKDGLFHNFESLLGLPPGTLVARKGAESNRSMTLAEAEFLREVNATFAPDMDWNRYRTVVRRGLVQGMIETRQPAEDESRVHTPQWALDEAAERGGRIADAIEKMNVTVMGNLDLLRTHLTEAPEISTTTPASLPVSATVAGLTGVIRSMDVTTSPFDRIKRRLRKGIRS